MADETPIVDVEVISPGGKQPPPGPGPGTADPGPAIHPAAAALLVVVDNLWMIPEFAIVDWILTVPLCFLSVFFPTFLIQRRIRGDGRPAAAAKALFLAIVAAVPFSVTGTPVGLALLAWAGVRKLRH